MEKFLSEQQIQQYRQIHRKAKDKREADKIKTVLLLNQGYSYQQIAEILLLDDETIRRYIDIYQTQGLEALQTDHYAGGLCQLSVFEQQQLQEHLQNKIYKNAKEIIVYVRETFGVEYSPQGMTQLLHRFGFVYKKPKRVPGKADPEKQKAFIEEYRRLKEQLGPHDRMFFIDGTHPQHNAQPIYGWIKKGTLKEIKSNTGRQRLNINGAIDVEHLELVYREDPTINTDSTIALFQQLEQRNPLAERIIVIADNARYYRSQGVRDYLQESKIDIVFLPPYSPNLNLIERLWRLFNQSVKGNAYYDTFARFRQASFDFLDNLHQRRDQLASLLTENFQIIGLNFSQSRFT